MQRIYFLVCFAFGLACSDPSSGLPCTAPSDCAFGSRCVQGACSDAANQPPLAGDLTYTLVEDEVLRVEASEGMASSSSDPEGQPLRFRALSEPAQGSLVVEEDGAFIYEPAPDANGEVSFSYVAIDGEAESDPARVTIAITGVNDEPVGTEQSLRTPERTPLQVILTGTDADGDTLTFHVARQPLSGTLEGEGSSWVYQPADGFFGVDEFLFVASDDVSTSEPTAVSIEVYSLNEAPVVGDDVYEVSGSCRLIVGAEEGFLSNDTDPEGEALSFELVAEPEHGRLQLDEEHPGAFSYTPIDLVEEDRFTYSVSDGVWSTESEVVIRNTALEGGGLVVGSEVGACRLADAVEALATGETVGACEPAGHDRILLSDPEGGYGVESTLVISTGTVRIAGCGPATVITGAGERQIFRVEENGTLELEDLSLDRGYVRGFGGSISSHGTVRLLGVTISGSIAMGEVGTNGGRGAGGGGGGAAGLGGAVYVGGGAFLAGPSPRHTCTFGHNRVNGGNAGGGAVNGGQFSGPGGSGGGPNGGQGGTGVGAPGGLWSGGAGGGGSTQALAGGRGGFGGGGGGGGGKTSGGMGGTGGIGGFGGGNGSQSCCSASAGGGGGAGFGGAVFLEAGEMTLNECHFESNSAVGGAGGGNAFGGGGTSGQGVGGAIFVYGGTLEHNDLHFEENGASLADSEDLYEHE